VPTFKHREQLAETLQKEGLKIGVELGVQRGLFTKDILGTWKSAEEYTLVDLWGHQANYKDSANVKQSEQDKILDECKSNTREWESKLKFCRNFTTACVETFPDEVRAAPYTVRHASSVCFITRRGKVRQIHNLTKVGVRSSSAAQFGLWGLFAWYDWTLLVTLGRALLASYGRY